MNIPGDADWIVWLLIGLSVLFTVIGGLMTLSPDPSERIEGKKMLAGWWGAVAAVAATTLFFSLFK